VYIVPTNIWWCCLEHAATFWSTATGLTGCLVDLNGSAKDGNTLGIRFQRRCDVSKLPCSWAAFINIYVIYSIHKKPFVVGLAIFSSSCHTWDFREQVFPDGCLWGSSYSKAAVASEKQHRTHSGKNMSRTAVPLCKRAWVPQLCWAELWLGKPKKRSAQEMWICGSEMTKNLVSITLGDSLCSVLYGAL
jgi:hypothetical protein